VKEERQKSFIGHLRSDQPSVLEGEDVNNSVVRWRRVEVEAGSKEARDFYEDNHCGGV
jgi:hypothetical protein